MLNIGDTAPSFSLHDQDGRAQTLDSLTANGPLLIYFYPADFSPVCSAEACVFRDSYHGVQDVGAAIVGISPQSQASHARFARAFSLPFPLLADPRRSTIRAFGVEGLFGMVRRVTFLVDEHHVIANRVIAELDLTSHAALLRRTVDESRSARLDAKNG